MATTLDSKPAVLNGRTGRRVAQRAGWEFGLAGLMLVQYAVVCAVKVSKGLTIELWWMSHVSLLMGGMGVLTGRSLLVATALTNVLVLHALWLADFACGRWTGAYPIHASSYLVDADVWTWFATAHHFYLVPMLLLYCYLRPAWPRETLPVAAAVFLYLTVISRGLLPPASNINYAFSVLAGAEHPAFRWFNGLPGSAYLVLLNVFVTLGMFLPSEWVLCRIVRRRTLSTGSDSSL